MKKRTRNVYKTKQAPMGGPNKTEKEFVRVNGRDVCLSKP